MSPNDRRDVEDLIIRMRDCTAEVPQEEIDAILREGRENPLPYDEARRLNLTILRTMKAGCLRRGDAKTLEGLPDTPEAEEAWVDDLLAGRKRPT